jgi:hypothetical protein
MRKTNNVCRHLIFILALFCAGCFESKPPEGFEAVIPEGISSHRSGCPNLIDTYVIDAAQIHNPLFRDLPDKTTFDYLTFDGTNGLQYSYKVRLNPWRLKLALEEFQIKQPKLYRKWREAMVEKQANPKANYADTLSQGPVYEHAGWFHLYGCSNGWVQVRQDFSRGWNDKKGRGFVQRDLTWLARDKYGNLLIRNVSYEEVPGWTFWAAGGAGVNLELLHEHWSKLSKVSDERLSEILRGLDLPPAKPYVESRDECLDAKRRFIAINQELVQQGVMIDQYSYHAAEVKNDRCVKPHLTLGFLAANSAEARKILEQMKQYPGVEDFEILETNMKDNGLYYLAKVVLDPDF